MRRAVVSVVNINEFGRKGILYLASVVCLDVSGEASGSICCHLGACLFICFALYISHKGKQLNSQLTSLPMCGFIAQLVEHRTGIAEVTGSNPVEALIFFRLLYSNCLNWKFTAKITYHLHVYPQFIYESFHIHYIISLLSRENINSQLTSLPMCGFIAQLVEHRTGIAEVTGSNPVEALIFFRLLYSNCLNWKFTAKITYHLQRNYNTPKSQQIDPETSVET